ncbi:MAG: hypothetical protein AB7U34_03300 [Novosphingobium sp.]
MAELQFFSQSARDSDNLTGSTSRLVNLYPEPTVGGAMWLKSVLGADDHAQLPGVFVRAMAEIGGRLYAACGGSLVLVNADGSYTVLGSIDDSEDCTISGNNGDVLCVSGGKYYRWDGATLTQPSAGAFSAFGSVTYLANYSILAERGGRMIQWSDLADASDLPGLNFATADGRDDAIVRVMAINGALWVFKETSREVWYHTEQAGPDAFLRMAGGIYDVGLAGHGLIAQIPASAFLVGSDGRAHLVNGNGLQPVSTPPVETAIKTCHPEYCLTYEDEGHTFCAIVFRDCPAWVYDVATGQWHERAEGVDLEPWSVAVSAQWNGAWYVGRSTGMISKLSRSNADGYIPLVREATSHTMRQDGRRFTIWEFEAWMRRGFASGSASLSVSRDGGVTWGTLRARDIGPVGNYDGRVIWRNLGQFRQATARLRWTDGDDVSVSSVGRVRL